MNQKYNSILKQFFYNEVIKDYSLENIRHACEYFGNPQESFKSIHIAGTNGKGSVSKMIFQMLKESGKRVGVFTSPHLHDIRERFEVGLGLISEEDFARIAESIIKYGSGLSYFEKCVMLAFLYFREQECEYAVIEVGLGGRLDTTNIITPALSIITSISYDHQEFLGYTLEEIAYEKGGIIKSGIPVILYGKNPTIERIAIVKDAGVIFPKERNIETNLLGEHQLSNGRIAYEAGVFLGLSEDIIERALLHVDHHGRIEYVLPNLLIDGAHNEDGLAKLWAYLHGEQGNWEKIVYCANLRTGKSAIILLNVFPTISHWMLVDSQNLRVCRASEIATEIIALGKGATIITPAEIRDMAEKNPDTLVVIFGSLYMLAEFLD